MKSIALIVAVILAVSPIAGQQPQGALSGTVRDVSGTVLPGVTVEVLGSDPGAKPRTAVTDGQGRYSLSELPGGSYTVSFRLPGFRTLTRNFVTVAAALPMNLDATLEVGPLAETFSPRPPFRSPLPPRQATPDFPFSGVPSSCLHGDTETATDRERRLEALAAMRLIYGILARVPPNPLGYPDWQTLGRSKAVADLKSAGGATGELANKVQWGSNEPLPGWRLRYELRLASVSFAMTDMRDPCWFTLSSNDPEVVPPHGRIPPLIPA